jgi:hypothetical protein
LPGENIFGAGSTLSQIAQQDVFIPNWESGGQSSLATRHGVTCAPQAACHATYNPIGSGGGLAEFGNTTGALDLTKDANANNGTTNGFGVPVLDAFTGSDDPPTGPLTTSGTNLFNSSAAATGSAATPIDELTVPVLQAPVAQVMSLPTGLTIGCTNSTVGGVTTCKYPAIDLKNSVWQGIWAGSVPASVNYPANTWGAALEESGFKLLLGADPVHHISGTPNKTEFTDTGCTGVGLAITTGLTPTQCTTSGTPGNQGFILNVRSNGSGTTYTQRGALFLSAAPGYGSGNVTDNAGFSASNAWPFDTCVNTGGATPCIQSSAPGIAAESSGALVSEGTEETPGSVGYSNLADSAFLTGAYTGFSTIVQTVSNGGSHEIVSATLQSNFCSLATPTCGDHLASGANKFLYASPGTNGTPNVYTGANININGSGGVGFWNVPTSGGVFDPTGPWGGTLADDPDVYDHSVTSTGAKSNKYPIVAVTYDMAWSTYSETGSNIVADYGGSAAQAQAAGNTAKSYLLYATTSSLGQAKLVGSHSYYTKLPAAIDADAVAAVHTITP